MEQNKSFDLIPTSDLKGQIHGISLVSFLQMIELEQKTCILKISSEKQTGYIHLFGGDLIAAETENLNSIKAAYQILSWDNPTIEIMNAGRKRKNEINMPLMHILMEGLRAKDEQKDVNIVPQEKDIVESPTKIQRSLHPGNHFCLDIGTRLLIQIKGVTMPLPSVLIGLEQDDFLILKASESFDSIQHKLSNIDNFIVRSLFKGTIYAFKSKLIQIISGPVGLIFLDYPRTIEHVELRTHKRTSCCLIVQAEVKNKNRDGVIENISKGGCRCILEVLRTETKLTLYKNEEISFKCKFPGIKGERMLMGKVKNIQKKEMELAVGVEFEDITNEIEEIIARHILSVEEFSY